MEEKAKSYLSVKDIARIKSRHEETIRRWINTNKIEVPKFNSKKEGYSIPIESLIQRGGGSVSSSECFGSQNIRERARFFIRLAQLN